jgi:ribose transport system substrate-binding protein
MGIASEGGTVMTRTRRVGTFLLLGALSLVGPLLQPGSSRSLASPAAATMSHTIAISFPNSNQPIVQSVFYFAKQEAAKRGYTLLFDDPGNDLNKEVGTIDTWITSKQVGAIEAVVPEPQVFENIAKKARAAGIVWVTYAAQLHNEDATLTWDHYKGGYLLGTTAGDWINRTQHGHAQVAVLTFEQAAWSRLRRQGIVAGLHAKAPGAQVVAMEDALQPSDAVAKVGTILQAHPDLKAVLSITDSGGEGAYQAFVNAGHAANDPNVFIGGLDSTQHALQLILQKGMYRASAALKLATIGKDMVDVPAGILQGGPRKDTFVPYVLLTSDQPSKVRTFLQEWSKG